MKLTELKSALDLVGDSGVKMVIFEFPDELNVTEPNKIYPLVFWDFNSLKFEQDLRKPKALMTINCFILKNYDKNTAADSKFEIWDDLMTVFKDYIEGINTGDNYYYIDTDTNIELYDAGIISVDYELGIGYTMEIKAHC